jgi:hypothetical protein
MEQTVNERAIGGGTFVELNISPLTRRMPHRQRRGSGTLIRFGTVQKLVSCWESKEDLGGDEENISR